MAGNLQTMGKGVTPSQQSRAINVFASRKIAWVGETLYHRAFIMELKEELLLETKEFRHANSALEVLLREEYPLIIVRDVLASGDLKILPENVERDDYPGIACYVIQRIRAKDSANKDTPIIVPHVNSEYYTPVKAYVDAGATSCLNMMASNPLRAFISEVRKYIK